MLSEKQFHLALVIFGALLSGAYLHPFHIHPFRTYYHDALVVFGTLIAFGMLALALRPRLHLPALLWLPVALASFLLLQMGLGLVQAENIVFPLMYLLLTAVAIVLGASWAGQPGGAEKICLMLALAHLLAALLSVVMQGVQIAGVDMTPFIMYIARKAQPFMRPYANVAQPNQLALLLCFGLASVWYLYQVQRLGRSAAWIVALILLWGISLTQSRIGWIIVPLFALFCLPQRAGQRRVDKVLLMLLVLIYIALVLGLPSLGKWAGFASGTVAERVGGRSERLVLMQQAWAMASQHPWLGVGWFGFAAQQVSIAAGFTSTTYAEHAHNLPLNFAAELGWPATLLILAALGWWGWQSCVTRLATKNISVGFASLCLIAVGVHSLVEFPLWYAFVLLPVALMMGMVHQLRWPSHGVAAPAIGIVLTFMLGCLLLVLVTLDYQRVVTGFRALRVPESAVGKAALVQPPVTLFADYFAYFRLTNMSPRAGMSEQEIAFVERMGHRFGFVHVLNKLAEVYVLNDQPEKAQHMMLTLQRLHPIAYPEYFDFWKAQAKADGRYRAVFEQIPKRNAQ